MLCNCWYNKYDYCTKVLWTQKGVCASDSFATLALYKFTYFNL